MTQVWAFKAPDRGKAGKFIEKSIREGFSRFGWSYKETANLDVIDQKSWDEMGDEESYFYSNSAFLLKISPGDWIVHVNLPKWGFCMAAQVIGNYSFDPEHNDLGMDDYSEGGDFRHRIPIDKNTLVIFSRNDENVLPSISRRLKLQGRYWRIHAVSDFLRTIENLNNKDVNREEIEDVGLYYLKEDLEKNYASITQLIHKHHPGKSLEELIAKVFERMDQVENVKRNGSGWKTDYGADLIVDYTSGLPLPGLKKTEKLVVQIKSYKGSHVEQSAVYQIKTAIKKFNADAGMIVSTAEPSGEVLEAVENTSNELTEEMKMEKPIPIEVVAGSDVAKFLLRYGHDLVIDY
ncbi:MAG: restriction endonuclease [Spirochaetales bacterium]|nr:restriction endonuclease [Spirochaetales bacterium]